MKKILLFALVGLAAQGVWADDYKYLTVYDKNGNATDIELSKLQKITFTATDMVAKTDAGEQSFALANLLKMAFAQNPTPVEGVKAATDGKLQFANGSLVVGSDAKGETLAVYAQDGALVMQQKVGENGAAVSLNALPKGVYVVRVGNTAIKVSK